MFSKCKQGERIKCLALSERRYRESSRYPRKESARQFVNESMVRCQVVLVKWLRSQRILKVVDDVHEGPMTHYIVL